jgi:hypothetical protein
MRSSISPDMGSAMARPAGPTGMLMVAWVVAEVVICFPLGGMNQFYITKGGKICVKTEH